MEPDERSVWVDATRLRDVVIWPLVLATIAVVMVMIVFPPLATFLPRLFGLA